MTVLAALGGLAVATVGSPAAVGAQPSTVAVSADARAAGPPSAAALVAPTRVRLITGDLVVLPSASHPTTTVVPAPGSTSSFAIARSGAHVYVVPSAARTALDRLDLSLFDAGELATRTRPTRVSITYATTASPRAVPGVEVTSRSGRAGTGLVTAASSAALAKALQTRSAAELFAGVSSVTAASPTVRPTFAMHTVKLKVIGKDGRPGDGFVIVANVDDMRRAVTASDTWHGAGRVSIPTGNYQVAGFVFDDDGVSLPILPEVVVNGPRTVTLDARTATTTPVVRIPQPTGEMFTSVDVTRVDAKGNGSVGVGIFSFGGEPSSLSPVDAVRHGTISSSLTSIASEDSPNPAYTYALAYEYPGLVPRVMRAAPRASDLERVSMRYHGSTRVSGQKGMVETSVLLDSGGIGVGFLRSVPTRMTVWAGGSAGAILQNAYTATYDWETDTGSEYLTSSGEQVTPGSSRSEEWNQRPSRPSFVTPTASDPWWCSACVQDGTLALAIPSFSDNDPRHYGLVDDPTRVAWSLSSAGRSIGSGDGPLFDVFDLPRGTAPVVIDHREHMRRAGFADSTTSTTWTMPRTALGASLTGWSCYDGVGPCRAAGLLEPRYDLPISDAGTMKAGTASGRLFLTPYLSASTVTSLAVDVRYGSGPWLSVSTAPTGPNVWKLRMPVSTRGGSATLRLRASDSAGSAVTQTIDGAWSVAP